MSKGQEGVKDMVVFVQGPMSSAHFARFSKMLNTLGLPLLF